MSAQNFADMPFGPGPLASLTAITATTETVLLAPGTWTPIPALSARAGGCYQLSAGGIMSTGASGTLTITPRFGLVIGAPSMGASIAQTVPINLTAVPWTMEWNMTVRSIGIAASGSTVVGTGVFSAAGTAATAGSGLGVCFGGTVLATADTTVASGVWLGWTLSVAGSVTPQWVHWKYLGNP